MGIHNSSNDIVAPCCEKIVFLPEKLKCCSDVPFLPFPPLCSGTGMESTASPCTESTLWPLRLLDWAAVGAVEKAGGSHPGVEPRVGCQFLGKRERALLHTKQRQAFQSVQEVRLPGLHLRFPSEACGETPAGWVNLTPSHLG